MEFVRVKHPDVEVEAIMAVSAIPYMPGWTPVDDNVNVPSLVDGTIDAVLSSVGDDPQKAQLALDAELAKSNPRTTLVERLSLIAQES